ncbi:MAG: diguanylate cyclase [Thermoguttaceae bacterium]|nr:diguanylate cyclase [Thermoguttaceae bacterium]
MVSSSEVASATPRSVLVVDDDLVLGRLLAHWLRSAGYEVTQAGDGLEALRAVQATAPDILITDWDMPELDGIQLCRAVRQLELPHYVYIIVLTARSDEALLVASLDAGADNFLHKPVAREELLARVRSSARLLELQAKLQQAALVDPLTNLSTRRVFFEHLSRHWHRAKREGTALSCVICDIDYFKRINDLYGHAAGDLVLRTVAEVLRRQTRQMDCLARLGGEEFCALLPGAEESGAAFWAERARSAVSRAGVLLGDRTIFVTASFGVASLSPEMKLPEELLDRADQALLCAKQSGRDRVTCYSAIADSEDCSRSGELEDDPFAGATAGDVMTPVVVTLSEGDSTAFAIEVLTRLRTNAVPVVGPEGELLGIVSEKDVMHALGSHSAWDRPLRELMRPNVMTFEIATPVRKIYEFLCRVAIRRVVIVEKNKPVGTISRGTLLRWFRNVAILRGLLREDSAAATEEAKRSFILRVKDVVSTVAEKITALGDQLKQVALRSSEDLLTQVVGAATQLESLSSNLLACSQVFGEGAKEEDSSLGMTVGLSTD